MILKLNADRLFDIIQKSDLVDLSFFSVKAILDWYDTENPETYFDIFHFQYWMEYNSLEDAYREKVLDGYFEEEEYEDEEERAFYETDDFFREKLLERFVVLETENNVCVRSKDTF